MSAHTKSIIYSDDIAVDSNVVCHTERSEVSMFDALVRYAHREHLLRFNAFGDENEYWVNIHILSPYL